MIVDERLVFRFPKSAEAQERFARELRLLQRLKGRVGIGVPDYAYRVADDSFGGYRMLPGVELRPELFAALSEQSQDRVARQIAACLSALHATPLATATELGYPHEPDGYDWSPADVRAWQARLEKFLFPKISADERRWIARQIENYLSLGFDFSLVLAHGDVTQDHLLWDAAAGELGGDSRFCRRGNR